MRRKLSPATWAGIVSGLLFYAHALVPNSHAWPLLWPIAGGAAAMLLSRRNGRPGRVLATGARTGAVAGAFFLGLTIPTLFLLSLRYSTPIMRALGGNGPLVLTGATVLSMLLVAASAVLTATVGALLARPFVRQASA
jgi:hypothetical protein